MSIDNLFVMHVDDQVSEFFVECERVIQRARDVLVMTLGARPVDAIAHRMDRD